MSAAAPALPRQAVDARLAAGLKVAAVTLGVFLSGFVIREPAPYELYMVGLIAVWGLFGLRISRTVAPLLVLLVVFNVGGLVSMSQLADLGDIPLYLAVSLFLALTSVFFAAIVERQPALLAPIFRAWTIAAVVTASAGILGYAGAPGFEMFTRYGRAAGVFEDPNVFGPFLTLPGIYLLHTVLTGRPASALVAAPLLLVVAAGVFFSFSRGAWGLFLASSLMLVAALFVQHRGGLLRLRILAMGAVALLLIAGGLAALMQVPETAEFFRQRAQLVQDYDAGPYGRFARFAIGFAMAAEHPAGIGPLQFGRLLGEDTHNIWLKALLDYSWLGFAAYATLIALTLGLGLRILFRARPWQPYLMCAYVVLVGHVALGTVIDTDHWRHFYLLLGLVWGCIALEQRHAVGAAKRGRRAGPAKPVAGGRFGLARTPPSL